MVLSTHEDSRSFGMHSVHMVFFGIGENAQGKKMTSSVEKFLGECLETGIYDQRTNCIEHKNVKIPISFVKEVLDLCKTLDPPCGFDKTLLLDIILMVSLVLREGASYSDAKVLINAFRISSRGTGTLRNVQITRKGR